MLRTPDALSILPGSVSFTGSYTAVSTFFGLDLGNPTVPGTAGVSMLSGILLTSGNGAPASNNTSHSYTVANNVPGDAELRSVAQAAFSGAGPTYDASILAFSFTAANSGFISFELMFGSDEYPEYANTSYVDVAAVFINGVNWALLDGDETKPLSITHGNLSDFRSNAGGDYNIEYDGITSRLTVIAPVIGGVNTVRIGIADTGDSSYDSGLFIGNFGFSDIKGGGLLLPVNIPNPELANNVVAQYGDAAQLFQPLAGPDTVQGAGGGDVIEGGDGNDSLMGGAGYDMISGNAGDDSIFGEAEFDVLYGGSGADQLTGGADGDRFLYYLSTTNGEESSLSAPDMIIDFNGADGDWLQLLNTQVAPFDIYWMGTTGAIGPLVPPGTPLPGFTLPPGYDARLGYFIPDFHGGTVLVDENRNGLADSTDFAVRLLSGDPLGLGAGLNIGGYSVVTQLGDAGANAFFLGDRPEGVRGLGGDDTIYGGNGPGTFAGGNGNDSYVIRDIRQQVVEQAGEGEDTVWVGTGQVGTPFLMPAHVEVVRLFGDGRAVVGSTSNEQIVANPVLASLINALGGDDVLWGTAANNTLLGGDGNDIFYGGTSAETMDGGAGNDQFVVNSMGASIQEAAGGGYDWVHVMTNEYFLSANIEVASLSGAGSFALFGSGGNENLVANPTLASRLDGGAGDDVLWGSALDETLIGGLGDDILRGQGGADIMEGGAGNDQFVAFSNAAQVIELEDAGYDIVYHAGAGSFSIGENVEEARLVADGTGLVGNALANLMAGNNAGLASFIDGGGGADVMFGTAAADTMIGGAGDDTCYTQGGADVLRYDAPGWGYDQVAGFTQGQSQIQFTAASTVTGFEQLSIVSAGGNTQIEYGGWAILVFGVASMGASDFIFG